MGDLSTVKTNMSNAYMSSGVLISNVKNLINITGNVNVNNSLGIVNQCMGTIELINRCSSDFTRMYELNKVELHLFLKDFNNENKEMFNLFTEMFKSISTIVKVLTREYFLYTVINNVIGDRTTVDKPSIDVNTSQLIGSINRLEKFRVDINLYNSVLKEGNR